MLEEYMSWKFGDAGTLFAFHLLYFFVYVLVVFGTKNLRISKEAS